MIILRFLPHPRILLTASFSVRSGVLLGMMLIPVLVWVPNHTQAQSTETQQVSLEQGENLVSLRVQPEDASLAAIFEGHLDQIHRVKDEKGRVYMPVDDIEQFTTWDADESYKVYTTTSFDVEVTGSPISLTTASVPLEKGGNMIPYLPTAPQAVDEALASVSGTLIRVKDEDENAYGPGGSLSTLDSLRTGQGYELYVDQPDTLLYTIEANTLTDALDLEGAQMGQNILVQGRDELSDEGGGMFVVTNSGARMDGGTVFAFEENLTQTTETVTNVGNLENSANPVDLSHSDLEWRGFNVRYGPDSEDVSGIKYLHGHNKHSGSSRDDYVDLKAGMIGHNATSIESWWNEWGYSTKKVEITYKYATSDRRLKRKNVGNSVNIAWWGAPEADPNSPETADNHIGWALNIASRIYDDSSNSYDWTYVDISGEYYFRDYLEIPSGVKLRGTGSLNADGFTRGTLTWMPGEIIYHKRSSYSWQSDSNRPRAHAASSGRRFAAFLQERNAQKIGMKKLKFDGNVANNMDPFNNPGDYDDPYGWMQNSGAWNSLYVVNWFDKNMPVELDDIHVTDMGASGIAAAGNLNGKKADWTVNNLEIDTVRRNHPLYGLSGQMNGVTIKGHYWGGSPLASDPSPDPSSDATYTNLTVTDLEPNPQFLMGGMLADRRGGTTVDGFTIDLETSTMSNSGSVAILSADDQGTEMKNGIIHTLKPANALDGISGVILHKHRARGQEFADENPSTYKNIDAADHGVPLMLTASANFSKVQDLLFENVTVTPASGVTGTVQKAPIQVVMDDKLSSEMGKARRLEARSVDYLRPFSGEFRNNLIDFGNDKGSGTHPFDFFFIDSEFDNQGRKIVGYQFSSSAKWKATRVLFDNVTHPTGAIDHSKLAPTFNGGVVRMRNCQDGNGRTSDESGTYTSTTSDQGNDYVLIPTSLMSTAHGGSATVTSGAPSVTSVESVNGPVDPDFRVNLDQAIGAGNSIEIDYTARVTPTSLYSTTGLFVARAVADQSYTSANGPFTLDLRGTAASQESGNKITYTASSGDTSVVSASVQGDDYTLELTEQGTGTATITVTGEIEGIGTTTETFEVSIQ